MKHLISTLILLFIPSLTQAAFIGHFKGYESLQRVRDITEDWDTELLGKIKADGYNLSGDTDKFSLTYEVIPSYKGFDYPYYLSNLAMDGEAFMSGVVDQIGNNFDVDWYSIGSTGYGFNLYSWADDAQNQAWTTYNTCGSVSRVKFFGHPVPEPASLVLAAVGLALIVYGRRIPPCLV